MVANYVLFLYILVRLIKPNKSLQYDISQIVTKMHIFNN